MCRKRCTDYPRETWEEGGGVSVLTIYLQNGRENKNKIWLRHGKRSPPNPMGYVVMCFSKLVHKTLQ